MTTLILHRPHNVRFLPPTPNSCLIQFPPLIAVCITTASGGWTATQILIPIIVGIVFSLAFALWFLYQTGRLSRLTSIFPSMGHSRQARHRWTIDNDGPSSGALHHAPDAEATPMIGRVVRWRSLSPKDDATDRKRFSTGMGMGVLTPAFSKGIRSMQRLFGWGPIKVSRVPVPDTFDLEDPVTKADPFDTPRSASSRSWRNGPPTVGRNSGSTLDRIPSPHLVINKPSWSSAALESVLDNGQENDEGTGNVFEDDGANDPDHGTNAGNRVMLISRDGEDFSLTGSMISVPLGRRSIEVDRRSIEVVPPTPIIINKQPFRKSPRLATSASTPLLCPPPSENRPHRVVCNPLARMCLAYTSSQQRHRPEILVLLDRAPMAHPTWLPPAHYPHTRTRVSAPRAIPHPLLQIYKTIFRRLPNGRRHVLRTTFRCQDRSTRRIRGT